MMYRNFTSHLFWLKRYIIRRALSEVTTMRGIRALPILAPQFRNVIIIASSFDDEDAEGRRRRREANGERRAT